MARPAPLVHRRWLLVGLGAGALGLPVRARAAGASAAEPALGFDAFNAATDTPALQVGSRGAAVARAQILLDRQWFSTGEIDGMFGRNMQRIVRAWQRAQGLPASGAIDAATWRALRQASGEPLLTRYTVTAQDAAGPFQPIPRDMAARAQLKALPYESLEEALSERFHLSPAYLRRLNPGRALAAGTDIVVPDVASGKPPTRASQRIEIGKAAHVLQVLDSSGRAAAAFPISIGNERHDPLPLGQMAIKNAVDMPSFIYDPTLLRSAPPGDMQRLEIAPGPNNPVGTVWLGLTKPNWGIHGTPEPSRVGHTESSGCIHLTNWDAERLARIVKVGARVDVKA